MKPGIAVCFPGTGYTCKEALFERLACDFSGLGYDVIRLDFSHIPFREIESLEEAVAVAQRAVKRQLAHICFDDYEDIVFVSKSLGTILAAQYERENGILPRHLYLTPLNKTLMLVQPQSRVIAMVLGTEDRFLTGRALMSFCEPRGIVCHLVEGVNHNLKDEEDTVRNQQIIDNIANLVH
ncbi:MAG TPA: hypothetical protein VN538_00640 [Clostridia bacterium]|nr:hypothetical protein [Clostridia bacterium]